MAITAHYYTRFECNEFYHIYNRSVDLQPMFRNRGNYIFFLKQYSKYLNEIVNTYAYNLLGNHFHLLIQVPSHNIINDFKTTNNIKDDWDQHDIISHQFKKFFQSYAMAFNKQHQRVGTLFQTPFKRVLIKNEKHLKNSITYIHQNAQHHGLVNDFREWEWSSYNSLLGNQFTHLKRLEVVQIFGSIINFKIDSGEKIKQKDFLDIEL